MAHVKIVDRWEEGLPTPRYPPTQKFDHTIGRGGLDAFFAAVYVDDYLMVRVQHADDDRTVLTASASLAADHVRFFGPGEEGATPILAPKKSTDWNTTIDALGFNCQLAHLENLHYTQKTEAIKRLLFDHWPATRRQAKAKEVLSIAGQVVGTSRT